VGATARNSEGQAGAAELEHHVVLTNGILLHVVEAGPPDAKLVILLHGFPEFWYGWRHQIPYLANSGFRVWVPDLRGYNLSAKPQGLDAYNLDVLTRDAVGLIDAAGRDTACVIGHDWGGAIAWWLAAKYPERLGRLIVINCPHGAVLRKHLRSNRSQQRRSWYMFFFQMPLVPELVVRRRHWRMLTRMLRDSARPGAFSSSDLELYREAWSRPGAFGAMLNWYRAMFRRPPAPPPRRAIAVPTLLIWGATRSLAWPRDGAAEPRPDC
jgi:pimeloyl-ACP methyl ester carboxylesterase